MHRLPPQTPSPATTYCSEFEYKSFVGSECSQMRRRSQRLIDKDNKVLAKTSTPKCRSPQLFGESEDLYSQLLCQQEKQPSNVVHLKDTDKVVHLKSVDTIGHAESLDKLVHLKASGSTEKVVHLKPSDKAVNKIENSKPLAKILHFKEQEEVKETLIGVQEAFNQKNLKRKRTFQGSSQPAAKKRAKTPLNRHVAVKNPLPKKQFSSSPSSSQSKLPSTYPDHFAKQLKDTSSAHIQVKSAPAQLQELCPTSESPPIAATQAGIWNKSSPNIDSESSMTISLSDSIGEIFGSKDVSDILSVKYPRQYILIEEHLPALATMLNVDVDRLRNVLEITQRLTHDQILGFPIKKEVDQSEDDHSEDEPAPSGDFSGLNKLQSFEL